MPRGRISDQKTNVSHFVSPIALDVITVYTVTQSSLHDGAYFRLYKLNIE